jgi:hypothetical protein
MIKPFIYSSIWLVLAFIWSYLVAYSSMYSFYISMLISIIGGSGLCFFVIWMKAKYGD